MYKVHITALVDFENLPKEINKIVDIINKNEEEIVSSDACQIHNMYRQVIMIIITRK
jgi:hypothetical protein